MERPLVMTRERVVTSTLPPETTHTVLPAVVSTFLNMHAATGVAPAPSATVFCTSIKARMAEAISSSRTVTISSTYSRHSWKVRSPGRLTAMPSAMVATLPSSTGRPCRMDCSMEAAPSAWTPMTRQEGLRCLMA